MKLIQIALALSLFALLEKAVGEEYIVGGRAGWQLKAVDFGQWSSQNVYRPGDSLLFPYEEGAQSVMRVREEDFLGCRTNNPIEHYTDGNTIVRLGQDNYYFISGVPGHCHAGMKLEVVLAGSSPSGAPSSIPVAAPSKAPSSPTPSVLPSPTPAPASVSPVLTPSTAPSVPPTAAPLSSPAVAPVPSTSTVPSPSPITLSPPAPASSGTPLSAPAPTVLSPTPTASSPPFSSTPFAPVESPIGSPPSAATALPSAFAALIVAVVMLTLQL